MTANMYSDLREEARDHARMRNAYLEQVCPFKWYFHVKPRSPFPSISNSTVKHRLAQNKKRKKEGIQAACINLDIFNFF